MKRRRPKPAPLPRWQDHPFDTAERRAARLAAWEQAMRQQGHDPALDMLGAFDTEAKDCGPDDDHGLHFGPLCLRCGWSACYHCTDPEWVPPCPGPA